MGWSCLSTAASRPSEGPGINTNTDRRSIMSYAIVGFGKIGQALAHAFARKNIEVTVASRRPPEALAPQAQAIGPTVAAKSLRDALEADTNHLGGSVRGTSRDCEGPAELERQDGHRRNELVSSPT